MRNLTDRTLDRVADLGFLALFPAFVVYHHAVASEWIAPFAGGLFGPTSVVLALVCLIPLSGYFQRDLTDVTLLEWAVLFFILYLTLWTVIAGVIIADKPYAQLAVQESFATLLVWVGVYFVGSRMRLGDRSATLTVAVLIILAILVHAMIVRRSFIGPFLEFQGERDIENESSTYQSIGRNILATSIVFCALLDKFWKKILALSLTVVALLAVGSRAHLFAAAGVLAAIIALFMFRKRNIVAGVLFLVVVLVSSNVLVQLLLNTRAAELFDLAASTSWQARLRHQAVALDVLAQNPFFGDFGYHRGYGKSYAHNLLSAWTEYGAFAFFCFLGLCLYTLGLSAKRMLREHCSVLWQASFLLSLTALILAFGTESIFLAVFPPLAWGFTTNALRDEIRQKRLADISLASVARAGAERGWSRGVLV